MSDGGTTFRRPFGCAVLELSQLTKVATDPAEVSSTKEHTMPIFTPVNEATFSMLHQDIINGNNKEFEKSPRYAFSIELTASSERQPWQSGNDCYIHQDIPRQCTDHSEGKHVITP
jgi:hypothetical protein